MSAARPRPALAYVLASLAVAFIVAVLVALWLVPACGGSL